VHEAEARTLAGSLISIVSFCGSSIRADHPLVRVLVPRGQQEREAGVLSPSSSSVSCDRSCQDVFALHGASNDI
jgi:hypothetical protein